MYVEGSQCVLVFLSKGYFSSANCLRELDQTLKQADATIIMVHETDTSRGGADLATLKAECEARGRSAIFKASREILQWQRIYDFQQHTLKRIAMDLLEACEIYADSPTGQRLARPLRLDGLNSIGSGIVEQSKELYVPGEITRQALNFRSKVVAYASKDNEGSRAMGRELTARYKSGRLQIISEDDNFFGKPQLTRNQMSDGLIGCTSHSRRDLLALHESASALTRLNMQFPVPPPNRRPIPPLSEAPSAPSLPEAPSAPSFSTRDRSAPSAPSLSEASSGPSFSTRNRSPARSRSPVRSHSPVKRAASLAKSMVPSLTFSLAWGQNKKSTHVFLYLNDQTFVGEAGDRLAHEIRIAMGANVPIVLVHENDPTRGGCEFAYFFQTTPEDLIRDGLYKKLAVAFFAEPLREVSLALLAKALGATNDWRGVVPEGLRHVTNRLTRRSRATSVTTVDGDSGRSSDRHTSQGKNDERGGGKPAAAALEQAPSIGEVPPALEGASSSAEVMLDVGDTAQQPPPPTRVFFEPIGKED